MFVSGVSDRDVAVEIAVERSDVHPVEVVAVGDGARLDVDVMSCARESGEELVRRQVCPSPP